MIKIYYIARIMSFLTKLFGKTNSAASHPQDNTIPLIPAANNTWRIPLLDLRAVTLCMTATSADPQMAMNAVSYNQEDGCSFAGISPAESTSIEGGITVATDGKLAPGVLFMPHTMEHKWAIYFMDDTLIFVRSWLREVVVTATTVQQHNQLTVKSITGKFLEHDTPAFTRAIMRFLLLNYGMGEVVPAPLPSLLKDKPREAALWAFSVYGKLAQIGTFNENFVPVISKPLRSHSLLHIAVARGNMPEIEKYVLEGIPVNSLAKDGLAPLHWSLACETTAPMEKLLALGADPNVRSAEGATPVMNAVQSNAARHFNLLVQAGADVNAADARGFTALHRAAEMGHVYMVKLLLENRANRHAVAMEHTALSLAEATKRTEVIELLRD
jgi:hypothetical protein